MDNLLTAWALRQLAIDADVQANLAARAAELASDKNIRDWNYNSHYSNQSIQASKEAEIAKDKYYEFLSENNIEESLVDSFKLVKR